MQSSQTVTLPLDRPQPDLRITAERSVDTFEGQPDFLPVIDRLRIVYLKHINWNDELSVRIQDIAAQFICIDCSRVSRLSDIVKIAQDCRKQFAEVLDNDFDQAPLEEPVVIRNWKFEEWQLKDFMNLDKVFGQRQVAISPFDQLPFPELLPRHELAQAIIELLKTIPVFSEEAVTPLSPPLPTGQQGLMANPIVNPVSNSLIAFPILGNGTGKLNRQVLESYTPENNLFVAYQRYENYKKMANCSKQVKKNQRVLAKLEIDIAARKLANENHLQEIMNQEAQRLLAYFEERQQVTDARLEEAEQARVEIASLKTRLDEVTGNLKKLRADLTVQEKKSENLQQQIYVEQAKYASLAQEIQNLRDRCKKRPWWKFW